MFVDSTKGSFYGRAILISPTYGNLQSTCQVNFAYHKQGAQGGVMRLYLVPPNVQPTSRSGRILLWSAYADKGPQWQNATVGLGRRSPGYRLVYESIHIRQSGDMAIDDISFQGCALGQATGPGNCLSNQFTCVNQVCVDRSRICDFSDDCGDMSDEASCGKYVARCNFEGGICNWIQDDRDNFDWTYKQGATATANTGPSLDHTYGNSSGHYLYIETSSPRRLGDKARIKSPVLQPTTANARCQMRFYYHAHGADVNGLSVYVETFEKGPLIQLLNKNGSQPDSWVRAVIDLTSSKPFRVVIEAVRGKSYRGDIAIDDISFTPGCVLSQSFTLPPASTTIGPCGAGKRQCSNGVPYCVPVSAWCDFITDCSDGSDEDSCPATCSFDNNNFCKWKNDMNYNTLNWTISGNGITPISDHTQGTTFGRYAILQVPVRNGHKKARLDSPLYNQAGKTCQFSLWYNTHGSRSIATFSVILKTGAQESNIYSAFITDLSRNQDQWKQISATLPACASQFQIIIQVTTFTSSSTGYLAIDDLRFSNCQYPKPTGPPCPATQFTCASGNCVPPNLKCDGGKDCCDGSDENQKACAGYNKCTFEYGMCGWQQDTQRDQFDWTRHNGPTSSGNTGPTQDHTLGSASGYYLYIESSRPHKQNDTARLIYNLPAPSTASSCSVRFWYHMYGNDVGGLNVYINSLNKGLQQLVNLTSNQGNSWQREEVQLSATSPFQVIIEGVVGVGYRGDIAIDDITFTPGCKASTPSTGFTSAVTTTPRPNNCKDGQFACQDSSCIDMSKVCNFQNDCADGSDESQCPRTCHFEHGPCGWFEAVSDNFDFTRANGGTATNRLIAPPIDNTYKNQNGFYMYLKDSSGGQSSGLLGELQSSAFKVANADCKIQFSYWSNGQNPGVFYLYILQNNQRTALWRLVNGRIGDQWNTVTVGIGRRSSEFSLLFYKSVAQYSGVTAIDDIMFTDCRMLPPVSTCNTQSRFWCNNRVCIPKAKLCDNVDDCGDGSDEATSTCQSYIRYNFEAGMSDLKQGNNGTDDDFDWQIFSGKTPSSYTGPQWDHTLGNSSGHYLYMEASQHKYNQKAWLITRPFYRTNSKYCMMRMFYFMYGLHVNQLNVYTRLYNSGPPTKTEFTRTGEQGAYWQKIQLRLNYSAPFQVIIEAKVGDSFLGDIAIDDISFTSGCQYSPDMLPNPPTPTGTTLAPTGPTVTSGCTQGSQFTCVTSGQCIDIVKVCDLRADCTDNSDEAGCGECSNLLVDVILLNVAIKSANSTFSLVRRLDIACSLFDTCPHMLRGVLSKLLTFRISIIHHYRIQFHNKCNSICIIQVFRDSTCSI